MDIYVIFVKTFGKTSVQQMLDEFFRGGTSSKLSDLFHNSLNNILSSISPEISA